MNGNRIGPFSNATRNARTFLRFASHGLRGNVGNRNPLDFLLGEIKAGMLRKRARKVRRRFDAASPSEYRTPPSPAVLADVDVVSLCHAAQIPEQKLCILSFLRHVGTPRRWLVVSDGSVTARQAATLRELHSCVNTANWTDFISHENEACVRELHKYTKFAKKLAVETNLPFERPTIYSDSDVVFFEGAYQLRNLLNNLQGRSFYQQDLPGMYDPLIVTLEETKLPPANAGFTVLGKRLDWTEAMARLQAVLANLTPQKRTLDLEKLEQGTAHIAHVMNGSTPLDGRYVLQISDRLQESEPVVDRSCVMRHYVRPVRHKMWKHAAEYFDRGRR